MLGNSVQTKSEPTSVNVDVARVGYDPERASGEDVLGRKAGHVVAVEDRLPIVTAWSGMDDWSNCPPSYEVWGNQYYTYTIRMCYKFGIRHSLEDVAHLIMARFQERDSLGVFTPNWGSKSESGRSNFRSYYSRFIFTYVQSLRRNEARYTYKHCMFFDAPVGEGGETWGNLSAPSHMDDLSGVEFAETINALRDSVKNDALIDAVLTLSNSGAVRQRGIRDILGCDAATARKGLAAVKSALLELTG